MTMGKREVPAIDEAAIRQFMGMLHGLAAGLEGELVLTAISCEPNIGLEQIENSRFAVGACDAMAEAAIRFARQPGTNVYAGLYVVKPNTLTGNQRGCKEDVIAVLGLLVDSDDDNGKPAQLPLAANMVT